MVPAPSTVKRVRVRLKATDQESLVRVFGAHLGTDSVFLTSCSPLPLGTAVILEISYATREVALTGKGHVAWVRDESAGVPGGIAIAIQWEESCRELVDFVLARAKETNPQGEVRGVSPPPPVASDLVLDSPTPSGGTPAIVFNDPSGPVAVNDLVLEASKPGARQIDSVPAPVAATSTGDLNEAFDASFTDRMPVLPPPRPEDSLPPRDPSPSPSSTEYAQFDHLSKDHLPVVPLIDALHSHSEEIIPRVPSPHVWRDEGLEWDRQSGEVTPLARIELVRRSDGSVELKEVDDDSAKIYGDAVRVKSSPRKLPPKSDLVIGIDLGTTYSCAAIVDNGEARVIPSRRGTPTIPSVVLIHEGGKTIVGEPALRKQPLYPGNTIVGVKRLIGRPYHSPIVQRTRQRYAYDIIEGDEGEAAVRIGEHRVSLEEVSALILKEIKESASLHLHQKITRAVITCPAYYNERQREAVRTAGELAGLNVERVLSEPTAAALNYGLGRGLGRRRMLVYDLGGGTFDASLIDVEGNVFGVVATGGDTFLGGIDFDACVVQFLIQHIRTHHKIDPQDDPAAMAHLYQLAEQAKRDLSDSLAVRVRMPNFVVGTMKPFALEVEVKRSAAEELFEPLVARTLDVVGRVCGRVGVLPKDVDEVLLVGGQSRAPIVRRLLEKMFGKPPRRDVHPDEAVAVGAAKYAASMSTFDSIVLVDTLPMSIGIGVAGGRFQKIVEQDTSLPAKRTHRMETTVDGQRELELVVFQGEDQDIANDELIGVLLVKDLPQLPKGGVAALITFELDSEQMLKMSATDERTGLALTTEFITKGTPDEILARLAPIDAVIARSDGAPSLEDPTGVDAGGLISWLKKTLGGSGKRRYN